MTADRSRPVFRIPLQRRAEPPPLPVGRLVQVNNTSQHDDCIGTIHRWQVRYAANGAVAGLDAVIMLEGARREAVVVPAEHITPIERNAR
jgi:hypothetical protein